AAIESLAASRYASAHDALLQILKNEPPASKRTIVAVLARHPRPVWSDTLFSYLKDPDSTVAVESLKALMKVGHPKLSEILADALQRGSPQMREEAFQFLAGRMDRQSEELAISFTLQSLKTSPPSP